MHGENMWHFKTLKIILLIVQNKYVCGNFLKKKYSEVKFAKANQYTCTCINEVLRIHLFPLTFNFGHCWRVPSVLFNKNPFNEAVEPNSTYKRMVLLKCTLGYPTVSCDMAPSLTLNTTLLGAEIRKYYKIAKPYIPWF